SFLPEIPNGPILEAQPEQNEPLHPSGNEPGLGLSDGRIFSGKYVIIRQNRLMSNSSMLDRDRAVDPQSPTPKEPNESFGDILTQYEQSHVHRTEEDRKSLEGTVIAITGESVFFDIGFKTEGIIPLADFQATGDSLK